MRSDNTELKEYNKFTYLFGIFGLVIFIQGLMVPCESIGPTIFIVSLGILFFIGAITRLVRTNNFKKYLKP